MNSEFGIDFVSAFICLTYANVGADSISARQI